MKVTVQSDVVQFTKFAETLCCIEGQYAVGCQTYELAQLCLKIRVLMVFTIIIILSSHTIGTLQCEDHSPRTPLAGKVTAIHGLKGDHHDLLDRSHHEESVEELKEDDHNLLDRSHHEEKVVGQKEEEVKEEGKEKEEEKVTEEIETTLRTETMETDNETDETTTEKKTQKEAAEEDEDVSDHFVISIVLI